MGNNSAKQRTAQERKLDMYVVKNREYKSQLMETITEINTQQHCPMTLSLSEREGCCKNQKRHLHVVKSFQLNAVLQTDQVRSDVQILSFLSNTLCRQLSERKVNCWLRLKDEQLGFNNDVPPSCQLAVDDIAFGTLESANSFVTVCARPAASSAVSYEFQVDKKMIRITQTADDRLFDLEIENKHMHHIVHVVRRQNRFDVYFQLRHPPLMHECVNVNAPAQNRRFSRRSYVHGVTSEQIGLCDVVRVCFGTEVSDADLRDMFSQLPVTEEFDSSHWELRFTWIRDRTTKTTEIGGVDETKLNSFRVQYASEVLRSVGLRCRFINCSNLLEGLPENVHADLLCYVAELYESQSEYYLVDANNIAERWKARPKQSEGSMKLGTVVLTPTRVVFRRPTAPQLNRVLRDYFSGDRAEHVMEVRFRDENFLQNDAKNLHLILLYRNGSLDDQVIDATITDRLEAGIKVGQRVYRFLGGSNSLINNHGCYVCADYEGVTAESIRKEIGELGAIRNPAKYVSRLGLAFSSTGLQRLEVKPQWIQRRPDVIGGQDPNGKPYCFSDGVGKISLSVMEKLHDLHKQASDRTARWYYIRGALKLRDLTTRNQITGVDITQLDNAAPDQKLGKKGPFISTVSATNESVARQLQNHMECTCLLAGLVIN